MSSQIQYMNRLHSAVYRLSCSNLHVHRSLSKYNNAMTQSNFKVLYCTRQRMSIKKAKSDYTKTRSYLSSLEVLSLLRMTDVMRRGMSSSALWETSLVALHNDLQKILQNHADLEGTCFSMS